MREFARINRIQGLISNIWMNHPDLRYGQLVTALYSRYEDTKGCGSIFYIEDSDFEEFLIHFKGFV